MIRDRRRWMARIAEGHRPLEGITLVYITLPVLLLVIGWLRPAFSVPASLTAPSISQHSRAPVESASLRARVSASSAATDCRSQEADALYSRGL